MEIRPAVIEDAEQLARLHIRAWQAAYAGIVPAAYLAALDLAPRVATWRQRITQSGPGGMTLVAVDDGVIAGFTSAGPYRGDEPEPGVGEVYAIYADPDRLSTGVGRALMAAALDHLASLGAAEARLWVLSENARARRFYELAGFAHDGASTTADFDGVAVPEIRYARRMS